ncbi:VanW family protein [Bacillus sp. USDA818B3_A]|uniref:VanW family protein n=1 Tax=Bacillus sp. USDA818B3_A TaxID=2698834 RepID=UPI00136CEE11|nr:VanW family protein [Bacillus sp. USDA818B3_A]
MILSCILGIILTAQPINNTTDHLMITKHGIHVTTIKQEDFSFPYSTIPIIDSKKYNLFLDNLDKQFSIEPQNATINLSGEIVPEKIGSRIHRQAFTEQLYAYLFSHKSGKLEIPMLPVYPKVDSELLSDIRGMRIGRYITSFNPSNKKRSNNISLATEAINNYVIFPGENFSFNKAVGKRTASKGYLRAPVIIRGEFSEDIGGGICQVSSTLFNAVDNAGLKIIQRFSHTRKVPYIPPGRDATVSWYGPDFVFRNNYKEPILIRAKTLGHLLVIDLYSSDLIEYRPKKVPHAPY